MKKHRLTILVVILVLGTVGIPWLQSWRAKATSQNSEEQLMGLLGILYGLGRDYDCFFTIEDGWKEGEPSNKLEVELARRSLEKGGLVQELENLSRTVPNFSYEFNPVNPRVVHIIDARLRQQKGYALEGTITSLDFYGKVNELPNEIGKQGISIATPTWRSTHEQWDGSTQVQVRGEGLSVRDTLSNFIVLDGRGRILWIARTKLERGAVAYVFYPWPGKMAKQQ